MKLLHISDLHYRNSYAIKSVASSYERALQNMGSPIRKLDTCLAQLGPDTVQRLSAVLISGDLCDGGTAEDYAALRSALEKRFPGIPLVVTLGNHDDSTAFRSGWLGETGRPGPWHHITRIADLSVIALDNSDPVSHPEGIIDLARCDWLKNALEAERGRARIVMTHHHLIPSQANFPSCEPDPMFNCILIENTPDAILCGHTHQLYRDFYCGIPYRTAMSLSFLGQQTSGTVRFLDACGCSLYTFCDGQIVAERHEELAPKKVLGEVIF